MKTCKYWGYPTKQQERLLGEQWEACRWRWNILLAERSACSKIGDSKIVSHRPLEGTPKMALIRRTTTGKQVKTAQPDLDAKAVWPTSLPLLAHLARGGQERQRRAGIATERA